VEITNTADLKNLCEVSKYISKVAIPHLYESITLNTGEGSLKGLKWRLDRLPFKKVEKYTRHIWFKAPFHKVLRDRCVHNDMESENTSGIDDSDDSDTEDEDASEIEEDDDVDMEDEDVSGGIHKRLAITGKHILTSSRAMILIQIPTSRSI
jgi:hypothetical protein